MKRKITALLLAMIAMLVLAGWGKKEVRLLDSSKLIDLNKAIELAKPGGMAGDSEENAETSSEAAEAEDAKETEGDNHSVHDTLDSVVKNIVIRVRGERISYTCGSINLDNISETQLMNRIRSDYAAGAQVTLMDDFAETHAYKAVKGLLDELKEDIGLNYKEDSL